MFRAGLQNSYIAILFPPKHLLGRALTTLEETTPGKDGEDEEGEGAPLVQGGEGQGGKEVVRALREAERSSKEAGRRGKTKVCPHWTPQRKTQEEQ